MNKEERCPNLRVRQAGDESFYWCDLCDHPCEREYHNTECEEYNDYIRKTMTIICNRCGWSGQTEDLAIIYKLDHLNPDGIVCEPGCPACLTDDKLEEEPNEHGTT